MTSEPQPASSSLRRSKAGGALHWVGAVLIVVGTVLTASFPAPPSVTGDVTPDA